VRWPSACATAQPQYADAQVLELLLTGSATRAIAQDPPRIATGGKLHLWLLFIGFHTAFLVQHWLGVEGMPRRSADYSPGGEFTVLHEVFWVGELIRGISSLPLFHNLYKCRKSSRVETDDPRDLRGLEGATLWTARHRACILVHGNNVGGTMAGVYCRWERQRYQESDFELGTGGVLVHIDSVPLHTVTGRLVDSGELEADVAEPNDSDG